jgi:hypothetical protein
VIYSILGVKLFWNVAPFDPIITPNANFKSFGFATSMLVRCMMVPRRAAHTHAHGRRTSRALRVGALEGPLVLQVQRACGTLTAKWDSG